MAAPSVSLSSGIYVISADPPIATVELDLNATPGNVRIFQVPGWCQEAYFQGRDSGDAADAEIHVHIEGANALSLSDGSAQSADAARVPAGVKDGFPTPRRDWDASARRPLGARMAISAPSDASAKVKCELRAFPAGR